MMILQQIVDYFIKGGLPIMLAIGLGSLWAVSLIVERWIFFSSARKKHEELINVFFKTLQERGSEGAAAILNDSSGALTDVFRSGVENQDLSREQLQEKINEIILGRLPEFEKYLSTIATLGGIMPILGLLGTVTGMIETFKQIVLYGTGDPRAMADGISMALYTTQAGLVVALPIILFHNLLSNQSEKIISEIQTNSLRLINVLSEKNAGK